MQTKPVNKKIELLAPAGDFAMLNSAINAGADAIYMGVKGINMRAGAKNFSLSELKKAIDICHRKGVKAYLTLNTIIFEDEIKKAERILDYAKKYGIDGIIAWDYSVLKIAKEKGIDIHLSTQASVSNSASIDMYKRFFGIKRVVLARECTLEEIREIARKSRNVEIEAFCHGAMCVSESGRCFISEFQYGKSANRGKCLQPCRREYEITDSETKDRLKIGNNYVLSPKDLCTIHIIDKMISAGVSVFKIEGRARSPEYVDCTVKAYKKAINLALERKLTTERKKELTENLKDVFNRDFSDGFFMGRPIMDFWNQYGGKSKYKKEFLGSIINYYHKAGVFYSKLNSGSLKLGDEIMFIGKTTGIIYEKVTSLKTDKGEDVKSIKKGDIFTCKVNSLVRKNDKIYKRVKVKER